MGTPVGQRCTIGTRGRGSLANRSIVPTQPVYRACAPARAHKNARSLCALGASEWSCRNRNYALLVISFPSGLPLTRGQESIYYGLTGHTGYSSGSPELVGAGEELSLTFRHCLGDGVLLHARDSQGEGYFAVGVYNLQILVETGGGEVCVCVQ